MLKIKSGKCEREVKEVGIEWGIDEYCRVKEEMNKLDLRLQELKLELSAFAKALLDEDASSITLSSEHNKVKVSFGWDVKVEDAEGLKELLGNDFSLLVSEQTFYKPEKKLKEMALENEELKSYLVVKEKTPLLSVI